MAHILVMRRCSKLGNNNCDENSKLPSFSAVKISFLDLIKESLYFFNFTESAINEILNIRGIQASNSLSSNSSLVQSTKISSHFAMPPSYTPGKVESHPLHGPHPNTYHLPPISSNSGLPNMVEDFSSHDYSHAHHPFSVHVSRNCNNNPGIAATPRSIHGNIASPNPHFYAHQLDDNNNLQRLMPPPPAPPRYGHHRHSFHVEKNTKSHHETNPHIHIQMALHGAQNSLGLETIQHMSPHPPSVARSASKNSFAKGKFRPSTQLELLMQLLTKFETFFTSTFILLSQESDQAQ